jgi:hypothetical protein
LKALYGNKPLFLPVRQIKEEKVTKGALYRVVLPSSSSLNKKEVLIYLDEGKIEGSGSSLLRSFKAALMVALEHDNFFHLTIHLDNPYAYALNQSYESLYSFGPSKECPNTCRIMFWSIMSLCCQVLCHASMFNGSLRLKVNHPQYYHFSYPSQSIFYHFHVTSFVSIVGGYINALL